MQLETKAAFVLDDAGAITATAWVFADADRTGDVITKGAFGSIAGSLPMLWAHDQREPIGVWDSIVETVEGLQVRGQLLVDTVAKAREVYALLKAGAVNGVSIGFAIKNFARRSGGGRTISAVDLAEVSIVSVPAHAGARVTSLKSASHAAHQKESTLLDDQITTPDVSALQTKLAGVADEVKNLGGLAARLDAIEKKAARPAAGVEKTDDVERKSFATYLRGGKEYLGDLELKTLRVGADTAGGYLAPEQVTMDFVRDLVEFSPIRGLATVRQTAAHAVTMPKRTAITNAKWKGELVASEASEPAFAQLEIPVREMTTHVDVSNQLLEDAAADVEAEVRLALAEDFGNKEGTAFVKGSGALEPEGLLTAAGVAETINGHAANLSADAFITLMYALPAAYRLRGTWIMNGGTLATIRKLKDSQGNYLWQPGLQAGQPETILGRPVIEAIDMPDVSANAFPVLFGDFATAYRIVDRIELAVRVNPFLLATEGATRFHARRRVGAGVVQPKAFRKLKMSAS